MLSKSKYKIFWFLIIAMLGISNITIAAQLVSKDSISINENVTVTLDFGTYIGAYDSLEVTYNDEVLEYVSGDSLKDTVWFDTTSDQEGINEKSYVFKGIKDGISVVRIKIKGAVSANDSMDSIGDIDIYKIITVGDGYTKGDLNGDGKVNSTDAAIVLDRYKYNNASEEDIIIGDMNDDGKLNSTDAALILDVYKNNN